MTADAPERSGRDGSRSRKRRVPTEPQGGDLVYRHRRSTRIWHWVNALTVFVMLMSGMMIFNAHPRLYWGEYGANPDQAWLDRMRTGTRAHDARAFPGWATDPLRATTFAGARRWHFLFAWLLVVPGLLYWLWSFLQPPPPARPRAEAGGAFAAAHLARHQEPRPPALPHRRGGAHYNILQKASYLGVLFVLLPLIVLTGLTMSPGMDAAWPWLLDLFGGRQSARSIHFIAAVLIAAFIVVHLVMVVLAGPVNEIRSMITGRYRLPKEKP